jgi:hypothetical protein
MRRRKSASNVLGHEGAAMTPRKAQATQQQVADGQSTIPPPRPSEVRRKAVNPHSADPLEHALVSRPVWDSREPDPGVHELLYRFAVGDELGALAAAETTLDGRKVPALTVSYDVLDEIEIDHNTAHVLACVDGMTPLSRVVENCGLGRVEALRTMCELIERRLVVLRSPKSDIPASR